MKPKNLKEVLERGLDPDAYHLVEGDFFIVDTDPKPKVKMPPLRRESALRILLRRQRVLHGA